MNSLKGTLRQFWTVVLFLVSGHLLALGGVYMAGCGDALRNFDDVNDPSDDMALKRCRELGRAARDAGSSPYRAYDIYVDCTRDAGLR